MELKIILKKKLVRLELKNKKAIVVKSAFKQEKNLFEKLWKSVDQLLKRAGVNSEQVTRVLLVTDEPQFSTARRTAETVNKIWNWKIKQKQSNSY